MSYLSQDTKRNTALFLNDFDQEYADALVKLSKKLSRPLKGIILLDKKLKKENRFSPDKNQVFEQVVCDYSDDASLHEVIAPIEDELLLVTCSDDKNQPYLQRLLPHTPYLLGPTERSLDWATHKGYMRDILKSYDDSLVPKARVVKSASEAEIDAVAANLSFPVIIKPVGLSASALVAHAANKAELRSALQNAFNRIEAIHTKYGGRGKFEFIVEEFIEGSMYSVDSYIDHTGRAWHLPLIRVFTANDVGKEGFYTYHQDTHIELTDKEITEAYAVAEKSMHALGLRSCVAHIELFQTKDGWKVIEVGPRAGGDRQDMYMLAYGVDHAYNELLIKIGLEPEIKTKLITHVAKEHILSEKEGIIAAINGVKDVEALPYVHRLRFKAKAGDEALFSKNGGKMIAIAVLHNKSIEALRGHAETVRSLIKIEIDD